MITDLIAVGDCESSYEDFDIIVNLFLEDNGCELNQVVFVEDNYKKIYNLGLIDSPEYKDTALYLLTYIIPELITQGNKKILFQCYAGVSRSATFAIAYLMVTLKLSIDDAYNLVKSKRSIIHPNYGFVEALNEFSKIIIN
jgi:dual specificity MAP kinase phosphatase